jgi:thiol-disulfide isomerase/thioredoxin
MKFTCLFIALLAISQSLAQTKENSKTVFNANKKIDIEGKINHYNSNNDNRFITFRTYDIFGRLKDTSLFIKKDGNFSGSLFQPYEGDIAVMYKDEYITLYSSPGEKIKLEIDDGKWQPGVDIRSAFEIGGKSSMTSKEIVRFEFQLRNQKINKQQQSKELSDKEFAAGRIAQLKEELNFLTQYVTGYKVEDKTFKAWARNNLIYNAGCDIARFPFAGKLNTTITDFELMELLKEIPIENLSALHTSYYYNFLDLFSGGMQIIVNLNKRYDELKKQSGMNGTLVHLDLLNKYSGGIARQLMCYERYKANAPRYMDLFGPIISDPYLRTLMANDLSQIKPFEPFNVVEKLKAYEADDSLKTRLIQIFNEEKGKNVFIDFWGDWCAPCMHEMPYYPKLINEFKDANMSFLFFAVETSEKKAFELKNKYSIEGKFIVLSDNETKILNNVLQFHSYPSHFLIELNSLVVGNDFDGIFSGDNLNEEAVEKIRKSLSPKTN